MNVLLGLPMGRKVGLRTRSFAAVDCANDTGLGYLAAACASVGAAATLMSWNVDLTMEQYADVLRALRPQLVGIKVFTPLFKEARRTLAVVRHTLPDAVTVIGGPHPSTCHFRDLFSEFAGLIDYAVAGDGEHAIAQLIHILRAHGHNPPLGLLETIPGLIYSQNGCVRANPVRYDDDLDALPPIDWSLQNPAHFTSPLKAGGHGFAALVCDSRGCTARCGHCTAWQINGGACRRRSLASLQAELDELVRHYRVGVLEFTGNSFFANLNEVGALCEWIIANGFDITWGFTAAAYFADLADLSLLRLMHRAGCRVVHLGIESGNEKVVERLRKPFTLDLCSSAVNAVRKAGIEAIGYFMFGFPDETVREMRDTLRFSVSLPFDRRAYFLCLPLPGTTSYEALIQRKGVARIDWDNYDFENPQLPCQATTKDAQRMLLLARVVRKHRLARAACRALL